MALGAAGLMFEAVDEGGFAADYNRHSNWTGMCLGRLTNVVRDEFQRRSSNGHECIRPSGTFWSATFAGVFGTFRLLSTGT